MTPTPAEIHALNLKMAEKVMGWKEGPIDSGDGDFFVSPNTQNIYLWRSKPAWSPATSPAQAVEVAAKFGRDFEFQGHPCWITSVTSYDGELWQANWNSRDLEDDHIVIFHEPFALAVCKAISAAIAAGATRKQPAEGVRP